MEVPWQGFSCSRENSPHPFSPGDGGMTPQTDMEQFWDPWMIPLGIFLICDAPSMLSMEAALFFLLLFIFFSLLLLFQGGCGFAASSWFIFKCFSAELLLQKVASGTWARIWCLRKERVRSESFQDFSIKTTPGCELGAHLEQAGC